MNKSEHLLIILIEECNELAQDAAKALRFGVFEQRDLPTSNHDRMQKEFNDVLAVVEMLNESGLLLIQDRGLIQLKKQKVIKYMGYSKECGTLD
ncbi:hypothetical protein [uncultured Methylophaga sp.]|uniref:hypothetical protein n=1 Tax=uncultured Methylophaga sp. TaxID=285271 RepID=UPI0030F7BA82